MPDGTIQKDYTFRRAVRDKTAPLIMIAGPPGTGKTYSALRLARGIAGPDGKIFLADTDNGRSLFYADEFQFEHLNLHEPFRPIIFEEAAKQAQRSGASVLVIDNFMAEHAGPGGLLEWQQEINVKMARGDAAKLEATKMLAWIEPKMQHKRMRERLYQLNMPVIIAVGAERKIAMIKATEGKDKGKIIPTDIGFVPICGSDIPWAMTMSLLLLDVSRPGVPTPIKALLPALKPIIHLDRPLDEATGAAIAAWAKGGPAATTTTGPKVSGDESNVEQPPPPEQEGAPPPPTNRRQVDEATIEAGARELAARFLGLADRQAYLELMDDPGVRTQMEWLKRNRRPLYDREVESVRNASWIRTEPNNDQGNLIP